MRFTPAIFLTALIAVWPLSSIQAGFNPETGSYVFQHYGAKDYGASPQNWSIAQDSRGVMYFGNTDGLLEFDGLSWRLLPVPNRSIVRAVSIDDKGTVYVGAQGDFGFLQPDSTGTTRFVSLINRLPEKDRHFADVWRVLPTPQGIYFSTLSRIFRLNRDGTIQSWPPEKKFGRAFHVLDALYVQSAGKGLLTMRGDDLVPVSGGERFTSEVITAAVPLDDGALIASTAHLYRLTRSGVAMFSASEDARIAGNTIYSMKVLPSGEIAAGTANGGLLLLDHEGNVDRIITKAEDGVADDSVLAIEVDQQGGVWLAHQAGLTRFNPGLSAFGKKDGIEGDVFSVTRQDGSIYAGTTAGLFRMTVSARAHPRFERVPGVGNSVYVLTPHDKELLAGTDLGVFLISGAQVRKIYESTRPARDVIFSARDPNIVYAGRRTSVAMLRRREGSWEVAADFQQPSDDFRSVVEDADGKVWATSAGTIWRLDFSKQPVGSEKFAAPQGLVTVLHLQGHVAFATVKGLKRYSEREKRLAPDLSLGKEFADGSRDVFNVVEDKNGNAWVTGANYHGILVRQATGDKWMPMPLLRSGIQEIYWMSIDGDGVVWASGADYVLHRWERNLAGDPDAHFNVLTRRVQVIGSKDNLYYGSGTLDSLQLPWRDNKLRFEFAAPFYEEPSAVEYQVRLEGSDSDWSPWSHESKRDYTHLPEGSYQFHVRARTPHGATSEQSGISFGVMPPWYRTWWAYSIYFVLAGFGVWGIVQWRTKKLEEEKKQLEVIVEERTVEIRQQRDEIQVQERKSHSLLLNILPATVADELKSTGSVQPVGFEDVTVCFTDFVGFTLSSEKLPPGKLVDALNEYFTAFDEIIARYGLEKLKTIGDSYMFASGLPSPRKSHAVDAVLAALEMAEVVKTLAGKTGGTGWNIRIGLHSGPVVAGVVGIRKFAFDIWGNTVNFAARMESSGVPGSVNVSERTCQLLAGMIDCEFRGKVKIKEGRELPMFLARGPAREFLSGAVADGIPEAFARKYREEFGEELRSFPAWRRPGTGDDKVLAATVSVS